MQSMNGGFPPATEYHVTEKEFYIHPRNREDLEDVIATWDETGLRRFGTKMGAGGLLLHGPPGTGKSLCAQYLATRLGYRMASFPIIFNPQVIQAGFEHYRKEAERYKLPIIIYFDEIEAMNKREGLIDPNQRMGLSAFLTELQNDEANRNLRMIGASNNPDLMDTALRRTGRFGIELPFFPPDRTGRQKILEIHAYSLEHGFTVKPADLGAVARQSHGYVGDDLRGLLKKAFAHAARAAKADKARITREKGGEKVLVTPDDLAYGLARTRPSAIRDMPYEEPAARFADIGGYDTHKELLRSILSRSDGTALLFYGPKGTGKNWMAEALAGEHGYNLIMVRGAEQESKWVGETKDNVKRIIDRARQLAPIILVFDEVESFVENRGWTSHKQSQTGYLQSVLSKPIPGVYLIGITNRPDTATAPFLDRFPWKLYFPLPSPETQRLVWAKHVDPSKVSIDELVEANPHASCRAIRDTAKKVAESGMPLETAYYRRLITGLQPDTDTDWPAILKQVPDDVETYRQLAELRQQRGGT
jgi:transitional endoplasmic reticulum ATPase